MVPFLFGVVEFTRKDSGNGFGSFELGVDAVNKVSRQTLLAQCVIMCFCGLGTFTKLDTVSRGVGEVTNGPEVHVKYALLSGYVCSILLKLKRFSVRRKTLI